MFDGTLGNYAGTEYKIELQKRDQPYHATPFTYSKIHEETLKTEVNKLVNIAVKKFENNFELAEPTFIIHQKNGTVRLVSDIR